MEAGLRRPSHCRVLKTKAFSSYLIVRHRQCRQIDAQFSLALAPPCKPQVCSCKLKVLIVARPAMLAGAMDKAQMSACPMVRLTSDTACQKQHNSQRLRHRKSLLTIVSASKHFSAAFRFTWPPQFHGRPSVTQRSLFRSSSVSYHVPECGLTRNGLGKCHSGRRISTG